MSAPAVVLNGITYTSWDDAFTGGLSSPGNGIYYALRPDGLPPAFREPVFDDRSVSYPGVDGRGKKRYGYRGRQIDIELIVVGSTLGGAETAITNLLSGTAGLKKLARYTVAMPGGTSFDGCTLAACSRLSEFKCGTKICVFMGLTFEQMSETN